MRKRGRRQRSHRETGHIEFTAGTTGRPSLLSDLTKVCALVNRVLKSLTVFVSGATLLATSIAIYLPHVQPHAQ
jgi:hypothetical protein